MSISPASSAASVRATSSPDIEELMKAAFRSSARSASTWSCISAISGETITPVPVRTSEGIW